MDSFRRRIELRTFHIAEKMPSWLGNVVAFCWLASEFVVSAGPEYMKDRSLRKRSRLLAERDETAPQPKTFSNVPGLNITFEKRAGVLFDREELFSSQKTALTSGSYYEVTINSTGENPDYPVLRSEWKKAVTIHLGPKADMKIAGDQQIYMLPEDAQISSFEVREEFDNSKEHDFFDAYFYKGDRQPNHTAQLCIVYNNAPGKHAVMTIPYASRASEKTEEWKNSL